MRQLLNNRPASRVRKGCQHIRQWVHIFYYTIGCNSAQQAFLGLFTPSRPLTRTPLYRVPIYHTVYGKWRLQFPSASSSNSC